MRCFVTEKATTLQINNNREKQKERGKRDSKQFRRKQRNVKERNKKQRKDEGKLFLRWESTTGTRLWISAQHQGPLCVACRLPP
jgi:hypothetical protein